MEEKVIYTKEELIKDVKEVIDAIWKLDPPTENPYNWELISTLNQHLKELKKAKTDEEALSLAKKFKEKNEQMLLALRKHLALREIL